MIRFIVKILLFDLLILTVAGIPAWYFAGWDIFFPLLVSIIITSILATISFIPFTRMKAQTMNSYMLAVLIGMLVRMFFIGASVVVIILFTTLNKVVFTVGLLFSYICKSVIETYILTQKVKKDTTAK